MSALPSEVESAFKFKGNINFGVNGTIYRVKKRSNINLGNHKYYAMKIISIPPDGNLKNIEFEIKILSELNNPYLVHLDSYFRVKNHVFMAMEYCENSDLLKAITEKKVRNQVFNEDEIWQYFIQTSFGLEALHEKGYIHRDIKPENILLDENNDVKLGDFGLSRYLQASSVGGTPHYWSPRMCHGEAATQESDIWALGCVLYYLCNLEDPFKGIKGKIQNEPHGPIQSRYSQKLRYLVDWCLKKKRNERPTINEIISDEFIIEKTISLGIRIPKTSAMSTRIRILLDSEREKNLKLEKKLSKRDKKITKQKTKIEIQEAELENLKNIIAAKNLNNDIETFKLKAVKIANFLEKLKTLNKKQLIELKKSVNDLIVDSENINKIIHYSDKNLNLKEPEIAQNQFDIITAKKIIKRRSKLLNSSNSAELENEFRRTCSAYEDPSTALDAPVMQAYQDYLTTYHQKTSLFNIDKDGWSANLLIYKTETQTKDSKVLKAPLYRGTCIAQLPNGKLFFFGHDQLFSSGITLLIDANNDYRVEQLPSGTLCRDSSAIYFNNNIYCFGGRCHENSLTLSSRFDLDRNQWNELTPLPKADYWCNSIIFNGNILISGYENKNLWRYSIDNNFYRRIPYDFAERKRKILIYAERLYLIECNNGSMYESEIGSDTAWRQIENNSTIGFDPYQTYFIYNKGGIYIGCIDCCNNFKCFKFNLNEKRLIIELV